MAQPRSLQKENIHLFVSRALKTNADYQNIWNPFTTSLHTRHCQAYSKISFVSKTVNIYNIDIVNAIVTDFKEKILPKRNFVSLPTCILARERTSTTSKMKKTSKHVDVAKAKHISSMHHEVSMLFLDSCKSGNVYFY